jgi:uncharacterized protein with FMN-binding domain
MKRAIIVGLGTLAGATAVLGYHPGAILTASANPVATTTASVAATAATTTDTGTTTTNATTTASPQTYTGDAVQIRWGTVQVQATVENGQLTDVTALSYPTSDGHSAQLSAMAIPALEQQAISAQSASLDGVSGASYTSAAFAQSLQSALVQAGLA